MKNQLIILLLTLFCAPAASCTAQPADSAKIAGVWKGTSLCQVKNSPCHDENVVYYISKRANTEYTFTLRANKIVNGKEEEMGELDFVYDKTRETLTYKTTDRRGRESIWVFKIEGDKIYGTLTIEGNTLYRLIEVTRAGGQDNKAFSRNRSNRNE